jgi:hypothetical protein
MRPPSRRGAWYGAAVRQEWIIGGIFGLGTVAGGVLTWRVLTATPNPVALSEELESRLISLPFRAIVPTYLPADAQQPTVDVRADAKGQVQALLSYRTPKGCFGLLEAASGLTGVPGNDAVIVANPALGSATVVTQPELGSSPLGGGRLGTIVLLGPSHLGSAGCAQPLDGKEAQAVVASLRPVDAPPPPLPKLQ